MKTTVGTSDRLMDGLDDDFLGYSTPQGDGRVRRAVADEQRSPEDGLAVELDEVALVEAEGHQAAADPLATGEVGDPQGDSMGRFEQVHEFTSPPVYPITPANQAKSSARPYFRLIL
jgi:hypothetical protein